MSNNKQSSVEWVIENLTLIHALLSRREIGVEFFNRKYNEIVEQGNSIHKQEQINTFKHAQILMVTDSSKIAEQYYNETFGGNNSFLS